LHDHDGLPAKLEQPTMQCFLRAIMKVFLRSLYKLTTLDAHTHLHRYTHIQAILTYFKHLHASIVFGARMSTHTQHILAHTQLHTYHICYTHYTHLHTHNYIHTIAATHACTHTLHTHTHTYRHTVAAMHARTHARTHAQKQTHLSTGAPACRHRRCAHDRGRFL